MWRGNHETKNYFVIFYGSFMVDEDVFSLINFSLEMKNENKNVVVKKLLSLEWNERIHINVQFYDGFSREPDQTSTPITTICCLLSFLFILRLLREI